MKNLFICFAIAIATLFSQLVADAATLPANTRANEVEDATWGNKRITGSGNIIEKEIKLSGKYSTICVSRSVNVIMENRSNDKVVISADDNVMEYVVCKVEGGKLTATIDNKINSISNVNVKIYLPKSDKIDKISTASAGEAIMAHRFKEYQPYKGDIERRVNGSMVAMESGTAFAYAIDKLQDRGKFFIYPQDEVYAGQVVGEHVHEKDLVINVTKSKKLTNMRASGSDDKARIIPPVVFSLEEALEYIKADEYVEVTPKSMRMRKVILDELERKRANKE